MSTVSPNSKKSGKKKDSAKKKETVDSKWIEIASAAKTCYLQQCKLFKTDPINCIMGQLDKCIKDSEKFDKIILRGLIITPAQISSLTKPFLLHESLTHLCFWGSQLPLNALDLVQKFSKRHLYLKNLQLVSCNLTNAAVLANIVQYTQSIHTFEVDLNPLADGISMIIEAASNNKLGVVKKLSFRYCSASEKCLMQLSSALLSLRNVQDIDFGGNSLGDDGLSTICRSLTATSSLKRLSLAYNEITDAERMGNSVTEIMRASFVNGNSIELIDLRGNYISEMGAVNILLLLNERKAQSKTPLTILVAERVPTALFEKIQTFASSSKSSKKKKGKGKKKKK